MATEDFSGTLANWAQWNPAWGNCSISAGQLSFPGGQDCGIRWTGAGSFGASQYSEEDVVGAVWVNQYAGVGVRMAGADATRAGYFARLFDDDATNKTLALVKYAAGTPTVLATTTFATGANFRLRIEVEPAGADAVLRVFVGATQVTALNFTDSSSPLSGGEPGILGQGGTLRVDNWAGGNFSVGPTITALAATAAARASASGSLSNTGAGTRTVSAELVDEDGVTPMANLSGLRVVLWQDFAAFAAGAAPLQVLTGQTTNAAGLIQFSGPGSLVVGTDSAWAVITNQDASPDAIERASVGAMDVT